MRTTKTPSAPALVISVSPTTFSSGSCSWPPMTRWMPGTSRAIRSSAGMSWCVTATTIGLAPRPELGHGRRGRRRSGRGTPRPGPGSTSCGVSATVSPKKPTCDAAPLDHVRRARAAERPAGRPVQHVRGHPREARLAHPREQRRRAEVELVVPERGDVEPELVPGRDHLLAPEHRRHDGRRDRVAGQREQRVGRLRARPRDQRRDPRHAALLALAVDRLQDVVVVELEEREAHRRPVGLPRDACREQTRGEQRQGDASRRPAHWNPKTPNPDTACR